VLSGNFRHEAERADQPALREWLQVTRLATKASGALAWQQSFLIKINDKSAQPMEYRLRRSSRHRLPAESGRPCRANPAGRHRAGLRLGTC